MSRLHRLIELWRKRRLLVIELGVLLVLFAYVADGAWERFRRDREPDPMVERSYAKYFSLSLKFAATGEHGGFFFMVRLQNESSTDVTILTDDQRFVGMISVTPESGESFELYDPRYNLGRLTGIVAMPPPFVLKAHARIEWTLPLSKIVRSNGEPIDHAQLRGSLVHAELAELAVVPRNQSFISANAAQVSPALRIP
ncbi:MAG TPA: hypothetical protein VGO11_22935 [Chthoniobacteraceae bacterium]|jgi:hypothetical protein|nr:hypothetical protein [Chthoniobacteraceae bacterium]